MDSIWSKTRPILTSDDLTGTGCADVVVIGAGMAGILTAYQLWRQGVNVLVLEASGIGSGQTKNTTAKITSQHGMIYSKLIRQFGRERGEQYAFWNQWAVKEYLRIVEREKISCGLKTLPAILYTGQCPIDLEQECNVAKMLNLPATFLEKTELPFPVSCALRFEGQAQFHPLDFLFELSKRLRISRARALRVEGNTVHTDRGNVRGKAIVFATHYPFPNMPGLYFAKMHQERSYVLALEKAETVNAMYYGVDRDGLSLRQAGRLLLLGGGSHRTGENSMGGQYKNLANQAKGIWKEAEIITAWSAQDCITLDGVPYIGRFSPSTPDWYIATGFGKWGMSTSMVASKIISEMIVKGKCPGAEVFSPNRFIPAGVPAFFREAGHSSKGLLKEIFYRPRKEFHCLGKDQGMILRYHGKKRGAYKAKDGKVYLVSTRCPHLGCQLEWNPEERSWDCPCHGSRFDYTGKLVDNPAQEALPLEKESKDSL